MQPPRHLDETQNKDYAVHNGELTMKRSSRQDPLLDTLLERLERIPADSVWAHRASGIRGALLGAQDALEHGDPVDPGSLQFLLTYGFKLLEQAARERGKGEDPTGDQ
jgi:hypothetical protein